MNNTDEFCIETYYDDITDISIDVAETVNDFELVVDRIRLQLKSIVALKKRVGDIPISPTSNITINDVHRSLLFLELLLNQTRGVINTSTFQEIVTLADYSVEEDEL